MNFFFLAVIFFTERNLTLRALKVNIKKKINTILILLFPVHF